MFPGMRTKSSKRSFIPWLELLEKREVLDATLRFHTQQITVSEQQTSTPVTVTVELSEPSAEPVEFFCNLLTDGSATEEVDFHAHREHFIIPAGQTSLVTPLAHLYDDSEEESAETFSLELVSVDGTLITSPLLDPEGNPLDNPGLVTITITDNDAPPLPQTALKGLIDPGLLTSNQETWQGGDLGVSLADGTVATVVEAGGILLEYNAATLTNAVTQLRYYFDQTPPAEFTVRLSFQGNTTETVYAGSAREANQEIRLGVVLPTQGLATGRYSYTVDVLVEGNILQSYAGNLNWVNRSGSVVGAGWVLGGVEVLTLCARTRLSDGQLTEYFWDHRNQLTKALVKDANGILLKELRFTYDVQGRRVGMWVDTDGAGPGDPDQAWTVYDGANPYMDFDGEGQLQTRYLTGPGVDELFARIGAGEDPEWYLTDRLGSVRRIVDASGTTLDDLVYDSFGGMVSESNPEEGDRFKFTGREYSSELDIYYYRARWYDPATGQFISPDPIGFQAGDANLYRYVGNAPGDATDPSGLTPKLILRPDGTVISINIPEGQDPNKFIEKYYPGAIFHGSKDKEAFSDPNLIPFLPQPKDPHLPTNPNSQEWSESDFIELGLGLAGFFYEPLDWALTANEIRKDPTNYWNYLAFLPGISIGMIKGCRKSAGYIDNLNKVPPSIPIPKHPFPNIPGSPATSPGPGWTWRGKPGEPIGGDKGAWFNPKTGETLHPDLGHGGNVGPHWDWRDPDGNFWRLFPDGRIKPRE